MPSPRQTLHAPRDANDNGGSRLDARFPRSIVSALMGRRDRTAQRTTTTGRVIDVPPAVSVQ